MTVKLIITAISALVLTLALAGCSSAPPAQWMLYSRGSYLYGRAEAYAEMTCKDAPPAKLALACAEAAKIQQEVRVMNPLIQQELAKKEPDWTQIMKYLDLAIGLASKFLMVP